MTRKKRLLRASAAIIAVLPLAAPSGN